MDSKKFILTTKKSPIEHFVISLPSYTSFLESPEDCGFQGRM